MIGFAGEATAGASLLNHVVVEYAGDFNGYSPGNPADLLVRPATVGAFIKNSVFCFSAGCGITVARYVNEQPSIGFRFIDSFLGNPFQGNGGADQCGPFSVSPGIAGA